MLFYAQGANAELSGYWWWFIPPGLRGGACSAPRWRC